MERMNSQTPPPGLPMPKKPKRSTHANIAMSITFLMPNFFKKKGINKIHKVSEICDREISILECCTPKVSAYSFTEAKLLMNGFAKPLVICREAPNNIEKMKKIAILFCLKREKASKPRA